MYKTSDYKNNRDYWNYQGTIADSPERRKFCQSKFNQWNKKIEKIEREEEEELLRHLLGNNTDCILSALSYSYAEGENAEFTEETGFSIEEAEIIMQRIIDRLG